MASRILAELRELVQQPKVSPSEIGEKSLESISRLQAIVDSGLSFDNQLAEIRKDDQISAPFLLILTSKATGFSDRVTSICLSGVNILASYDTLSKRTVSELVSSLYVQVTNKSMSSTASLLMVMQIFVSFVCTRRLTDLDQYREVLSVFFRLYANNVAMLRHPAEASLKHMLSSIVEDVARLSKETRAQVGGVAEQENHIQGEGPLEGTDAVQDGPQIDEAEKASADSLERAVADSSARYEGQSEMEELKKLIFGVLLSLLEDLCLSSLGQLPSWLPPDVLSPFFSLDLLGEFLSRSDRLVEISQISSFIEGRLTRVVHHALSEHCHSKSAAHLVLKLSALYLNRFALVEPRTSSAMLEQLRSLLNQSSPYWLQMFSLETCYLLTSGGFFDLAIGGGSEGRHEEKQETTSHQILDSAVKLFVMLGRYVKSSLVETGPEDRQFPSSLEHQSLLLYRQTARHDPSLAPSAAYCASLIFQSTVDVINILTSRCASDSFQGDGARCAKVVEGIWPSVLSILSHVFQHADCHSTAQQRSLRSFHNFIKVCSMLRLSVPRDATIEALLRFAVPPAPVASDSSEGGEGRLARLSQKNITAMKTIISIAYTMGGVLEGGWNVVTEALFQFHLILESSQRVFSSDSINSESLAEEEEVAGGKKEPARIRSSEDALDDQSYREEYDTLVCSFEYMFSSSAYASDQDFVCFFDALLALAERHFKSISAATDSRPAQFFALKGALQLLQGNLSRAELLWNHFSDCILKFCEHENAQARLMAAKSLCYAVLEGVAMALKASYSSADEQGPAYASLQAMQKRLLISVESMLDARYMDVRLESLEVVYSILHNYGQALSAGWHIVLSILFKVGISGGETLVTLGFKSIQIIVNDYLDALPQDSIYVIISTIGSYTSKAVMDVNVNISAIGLFWNVADFLARKQDDLLSGSEATSPEFYRYLLTSSLGDGYHSAEMEKMPVDVHLFVSQSDLTNGSLDLADLLWLVLFRELTLCANNLRNEIRDCAIHSIYGILSTYGSSLKVSLWDVLIRRLLLPSMSLIQIVTSRSNRSKEPASPADSKKAFLEESRETQVIFLYNFSRVFKGFLTSVFCSLPKSTFERTWRSFLDQVEVLSASDSNILALAAIHTISDVLHSMYARDRQIPHDLLSPMRACAWRTLQRTSRNVSRDKFKFRAVSSLVEALEKLYDTVRLAADRDGSEHLERLLNVLQAPLLVPLETVGEFSALQKQITSILLNAASITSENDDMRHPFVNQVASLLLTYIARTVNLPYSATCYRASDAVLYQLDMDEGARSQAQSDLPLTLHPGDRRTSSHLSPSDSSGASPSVDSRSFGLIEQVISALSSIWDMVSSPPQQPASTPPITESAKTKLFVDLIAVLGNILQLRHLNPSAWFWCSLTDLFCDIVNDALPYFPRPSEHPSSHSFDSRASDFLWTHIINSISSFLLNVKHSDLFYLSGPSSRVNRPTHDPQNSSLPDAVLASESKLLSLLTRHLFFVCDGSPISQDQILDIVYQGCNCSDREAFSRLCYDHLFSLAEDPHHPLLAKLATRCIVTRGCFVLKKFIVDDKLSGALPLPSSRIAEVTYLLKKLVLHACISEPHDARSDSTDHRSKRYLLKLFPTFCNCILTKEREVKYLLRDVMLQCCEELNLD